MATGILETEWGPLEWRDTYWVEFSHKFGTTSSLHHSLESARRRAEELARNGWDDVTVRTSRHFGIVNIATEKFADAAVSA